jgi:hypothetical protein
MNLHQISRRLRKMPEPRIEVTPPSLHVEVNSFTINGLTIETPNGMPVSIGADADGNLLVNGVKVIK